MAEDDCQRKDRLHYASGHDPANFVDFGRIDFDERPIPDVGPLDAHVRITTTICGTDVQILKGEYPVEKGLTTGHQPARRGHREARLRRQGIQRRPASHRGRHHAERPQQCLSVRAVLAGWPRHRCRKLGP